MKPTHTYHFNQRISQRGINKSLVDMTLKYGDIVGDKVITNKKIMSDLVRTQKRRISKLQQLECKFKHFKVAKLIRQTISKLREECKIALKILDKGGVVVVCCNNRLITAYNTDSYLSY